MDLWKFYHVTSMHNIVGSPMSAMKRDELIALLKLPPGATVLDIACGKGETLTQLAEQYDVSGVGVDLSPYCVEDTKRKLRERVPSADIEILELDGAEYKPDRMFDLTMCIGASWVYGGHRGTLQTLKSMTKPGGLVWVGEPYWLKEPVEEYLVAEGCSKETFGSHHENVLIGEQEGLLPLYTAVSSKDDWDRYEALQWYAAEDFTSKHPDDPDVEEILQRVAHKRTKYLRWGRDTLGWALYLFRKSV
ncbi:class I SAM-dependent methyltransferase [Candidatus Bathyarchaeota archaeon]|nr:class I SAM-dependent methyltransferase [Candidatus Bathyarchaeota archaeon]